MEQAARVLNVFVTGALIFALSCGIAYAGQRIDVKPNSFAVPKVGVGCSVGTVHSVFPLGGVFEGTEDIPGSKGNEINQIFGTYSKTNNGVLFIGWLYQSFNGIAAFEPVTDDGANPWQFVVASPTSTTIDIVPWLRKVDMIKHSHPGALQTFKMDSTLENMSKSREVLATLEPCFKSSWDGKY